MNSLQVEEQSTARTLSTSKSSPLLYVLVVVTAVYIILSVYLIFNIRNQPRPSETSQAVQQASIAKPEQRQAQTASKLKASSKDLSGEQRTRGSEPADAGQSFSEQVGTTSLTSILAMAVPATTN